MTDRDFPARSTSGRGVPDRDISRRATSAHPADDRAVPGVRAARGDAGSLPAQPRPPRPPEASGRLDGPGRRPAPDATGLSPGSPSRSRELRPASAWRTDGGRLPAEPTLPPSRPGAHSGGHARMPRPVDDDPLTSPSFPAINTRDSRSYRDRRPGGSPSGPAPAIRGAGDQPASALPTTGYPGRPGSPLQESYQPSPYPSSSPYSDAAAYGSGYAAGQRAVAGWRTDWGGEPVAGYLPAPAAGPGQYDVRPGQHGSGSYPYQELSSPYPSPVQPDPRGHRDYRQDGYYSGFRP